MDKKPRVVIYSKPDDISKMKAYSKSKGYLVVEVYEKVRPYNMDVWFDMIDFIKANNIQKVVVKDCSSLSRKVYDFLSLSNDLCEIGVSLHLMNSDVDSLLPDGKVNPAFKFACKTLYEFESIKRIQAKERLQQGFTSYRNKGGETGRKKGQVKSSSQYRKEYSKEIQLLREGLSYKRVKAICGTSVSTLIKLKKLYV